MIDASVLIHFIYIGWVKKLSTSTLAFDISQFFPSLNHHLLLCILRKACFDLKIVQFFSNYLVCRKIQYFWNDFSSSLFNVDVGVGQGSTLSSILSTLYLVPFLHIFEKCIKNLKIPVSMLLFVDHGLLIAQSKSFSLSNALLFSSYNIVSNFLLKFSLIIEHFKTEIFHFSRSCGTFNPFPLDLSSLEGYTLHPKNT